MSDPANPDHTRRMYLELLKHCLLGMIYQDPPYIAPSIGGYKTEIYLPQLRERGLDVPSQAHSMIGLRRMNNLQACIEQVLVDEVPGDLIETGVWRGGATIFMRGVLKAFGITDRTVWVADSFAGMPTPDIDTYPMDEFWAASAGKIVVDLDTVRHNFALYGLLDDQVRFLKGWFKESLPGVPIEGLAVLRLDGDLYESTLDALTSLYPKLTPGGFLIIDDYCFASCRQAVRDYRDVQGIQETILDIDGSGAYWRKSFS